MQISRKLTWDDMTKMAAFYKSEQSYIKKYGLHYGYIKPKPEGEERQKVEDDLTNHFVNLIHMPTPKE